MSTAVTRSPSTSKGQTVRPRRTGVAAPVVLLALAGSMLVGVLWLLRDPAPVFSSLTGALVRVDTLSVAQDSGMVEQELRLTSATGLAVTVAIRRPVRMPGDTTRRQLFLVLGGHERGRGAVRLVNDTRGMVFAAMDYPFDGDHQATGLRMVAQVPAIRRALYATPPAITLALDYLLTRSDVDPTRVELMGASFGVPFATIAAVRDPRVTRLWLAHGGGKPWAMIDTGLVRDVGWGPLRKSVSGLAALLASAPRFAPEHWIDRVAPRPVVMLNATDDERIPRRSVDALWNAAKEPKEQVWLPGQHVQGNRPEVLAALVDSVMRRAVMVPVPR